MKTKQKLYIKNMVCDRCIRVVKEELEKAGFEILEVKLGEAVIASDKEIDTDEIRNILLQNGFELLEDRKMQAVDRIKTLIIELIRQEGLEDFHSNFSTYLSEKTGKDYSYLSSLFSAVENITIERFTILQKIERVKELLVYGEFSLSEMAYRLGYSSVAHLSNQFRQVTGFSPTAFKKLKDHRRQTLDGLAKV
jgi:AraC-like DNA-binding protein